MYVNVIKLKSFFLLARASLKKLTSEYINEIFAKFFTVVIFRAVERII